MKVRRIEGEEKERLLAPKTTTSYDATPYLDALTDLQIGDVVAVEIDGHERREKIRFGKAATALNKSLSWLPSPNTSEIIFEVVENTSQRRLGQRLGRPK